MSDKKSTKSIISGSEIEILFEEVVLQWHEDEPPLNWESTRSRFIFDLSSLDGQIAHLGLINCYQWHLEDKCRINYNSYEFLGKLKVSIDRSNKRRVTMIDKVDYTIFQDLCQPESISAPLTLVTPGNLIDCLSILVLKRYHATVQETGEDWNSNKVSTILNEKIQDLCQGIDELFRDLYSGRRILKYYRTVKLYGAE